MNIVEVKDYERMSWQAANIVMDRVLENGQLTLGLATGGTPKRMYDLLIESFKSGLGPSYEMVTTFNLDEYVGLAENDPNSYYQYMRKHLFDGINVREENTNIPSGVADDLEEECSRYEEKIVQSGGIDLQILGIGENGHIGFNEPGTPFDQGTHVVVLEESTRKANARYFSSLEKVPTKAITMGIQTIMKSKEIVLLVSGKKKAEALSCLLEGEVTENFPASILKTHPNVTIIADKVALNGVRGSFPIM